MIAVIMAVVAGWPLAGCATQTRWEHASRPPSQWTADQGTCKRWAAREAEKDLVRSDYGGSGISSASTYDKQMTGYQLSKRRAALEARCLRANGYRPAKN
ncbi:hypothetical protein [Magnetospira sp. QH-2]|uniref:hypothetical protein n=1 Tax=Magnetospira sp. (strain QH-2) TaxID=1288970 RepID=UPI0005F9FE74|nr:hypothetical protein [Magnetospira sp. QH-2]